MISWIQNLIHKRGKIIFSILLVIIIVAFVFTIGAGPGIVRDERTSFQRDFYGIDLNNPAEVQFLQSATMVSRYTNGVQSFDESQFQQDMLFRQVRLHLAETLSIPRPTEEQLREFIRSKRGFQDMDGVFDPSVFERFIQSLSRGSSISEGFILNVLRNDFRLEKLDAMVAANVLVAPREIEVALLRERTIWSIDLAQRPFDSFRPAISVSDDEVAAFFENNQFRYEIPEEITISYVEFSAATVKEDPRDPGDEELRRYFFSNRRQFEAAESAIRNAMAEESESDEEREISPIELFEKLRTDVLDAWSQAWKRRRAVELANDFIGHLFEENIAYRSAEFRQLLREHGLQMRDLTPFTADPSTQLTAVVPERLFREALRLDANRYYSDVVPNRDETRFLVAFLEDRTPSRIPQLSQVEPRVREDLRAQRRAELFSETGAELAESLREELAAGTSFDDAATANELSLTHHADFTLLDYPEGVPFQVLQAIEPMRTGEVSSMLTIGNTGYFVHISARQVPEPMEEDPRKEEVLQQLRFYKAALRYQELVQDLIDVKLTMPGVE